ncbi:hypothetical protein BJ508DRAFT_332367 [Ascobolus immersus RN42]|uniref:Arabinanase/levansucrase/invertase n=1 Tax=Ascobolus immersus RN42 TaxID=1160509 RepID=A0A3N4HT53_ASCIM|nr:hypothetical protein BJ508DRAFT_332367 [Ascobolus immersus RN42]
MPPAFLQTARGHINAILTAGKPVPHAPKASTKKPKPTTSATTIKPTELRPDEDEYSYIFVAFTNESESNLYIYTSIDALNFTLLKGPAFEPPGTLIRDPSLHVLRDGTYLLTYTPSWEGRNLSIAKSTDLQNWNFTKSLRIPELNYPDITRTWAPEFFFDPVTEFLHIIVSISKDLNNFRPVYFTLRSYSTDGTEWTGPFEMPGLNEPGCNAIDMFVVYDEKSNFAGWGKCEGPCLTILPDGKTYRIYADCYDDGRYIFADSEDLYNWGQNFELPSGLSGFVRHGTVVRVPTK